jgi:hypothetical protein
MNNQTDLYGVLGIHATASLEEVRRAFRAAARRHHPDGFTSYVHKARASSRMVAVNNAYSILRDPALRSDYDRRSQLPLSGRQSAQWRPPHKTGKFWIGVLTWLTLSAIYTAWSWQFEDVQTGARFARLVMFSLVMAPVFTGITLLALMLPALVFAVGVRDGFGSSRAPRSVGSARLVTDILGLLGGLAVCGWLPVKLYQWQAQSEWLHVGILFVAGVLAGEVWGAFFYLFKGRRVARSTTALVQEAG